ncbi:hypothetical protein [Breoghania sp.]|uniref:hypothetical protein n=1 Tax=Breoghania sp. TaxID=2065378 RepID=UPI00260C4E46|nr:hypothetical protein [Breoghania sp.]MDJ0930981.1 hypothetical protein [Breoghania sp.]
MTNETGTKRDITVSIACLREGKTPVVSGQLDMALDPRQVLELPATDLFEAFFDTTYAYRFGPVSHDVTVARLVDRDTEHTLAEAFHFPHGVPAARIEPEIDISVEATETGDWTLRLATTRFTQSVNIVDDGFRPSDDWFHLAPGAKKIVALKQRHRAAADVTPNGTVTALNATGGLSYRSPNP